VSGRRVLGCLAALALCACTNWVPLTPAGEKVRVASAAEVEGCTSLGGVTGKTTVTVGPYARNEQKIAKEVESLARNEAATMGGDAIVPTGPVDWDHRAYAVFRCAPR
jgi:hypothetical protein